jgi:hypothetical protein
MYSYVPIFYHLLPQNHQIYAKYVNNFIYLQLRTYWYQLLPQYHQIYAKYVHNFIHLKLCTYFFTPPTLNPSNIYKIHK